VSLRTTAWLLALLGSLLLLNVALPQRAHDPDAYSRSVRASPVARVLLVTLQLGELPTSVVFVGTLMLLFANLVAVLVDRVGATTRRMRFASPTPAQVAALDASPDACEADTAGLTAAAASELLRAIGYRVADLSGGRLWGVKHRLALLGFPIFHLSFLLMAGGGLLIFLSRDVTTLVVSEGEAVSSDAGAVVRRAPLGAPPPVVLGVERVDVRLEDGKPIDLGARLVHLGGGGARASRINRPAEWGDLSVLTERAGIAPVLWVVDERGFTVDRVVVAAAAAGGAPTRVTIGGTLEAVVEPIPIGSTFPERGALRAVPVRLRLRSGARTLFDGSLVPGESAGVGGLDVRLQEVRYWVGLRLIHERGGPLLVAGFLLSVAGIIWRMVWVRREVVVTLCAGRLRVAARAEFFTSRGREEAAAVAAMLAESGRSRE
jgi:cytochrome c biogenesis protein ResB